MPELITDALAGLARRQEWSFGTLRACHHTDGGRALVCVVVRVCVSGGVGGVWA